MGASILAFLVVPLVDLTAKLLLRRQLGSRAVALGSLGSLRMVTSRIWLARLGERSRPATLWTLWALAAAMLLIASTRFPSSGLFVGLLLGGSLSNGLESTLRGSVSDYVCLRFWPAFNLADVAITAGAIGIAAQLWISVQRTLA
jgi:signal peptidase II